MHTSRPSRSPPLLSEWTHEETSTTSLALPCPRIPALLKESSAIGGTCDMPALW